MQTRVQFSRICVLESPGEQYSQGNETLEGLLDLVEGRPQGFRCLPEDCKRAIQQQ
jgi:hypothetical protein